MDEYDRLRRISSHNAFVRNRNTRSRLDRLQELQGALKARDHVTAAELAEELRVSVRTINRDLEVLRAGGVPIDADRGRGGGLRLQREWALGRLHLSAAEAVDLLLSMAIAEAIESPLLLGQLARIKRKIVASFAESGQQKVRVLRKRILIGKPASPRVAATFQRPPRAQLAGIGEAFFEQRCVSIQYVDERGNTTSRDVEPQFLYLSFPLWYLLAWDRLRNAIRYFRVDRIRSANMLETTFRLADPSPYLEQAERGIAHL